MSEQFVLHSGIPLADAVVRARKTLTLGDAAGADAAYGAAVELAAADGAEAGGLWSALAAEHIAALRVLGSLTLGLRRCAEYLDDPRCRVDANRLALMMERAQLHSSAGDHGNARADAAAIRAALAVRLDAVSHGDEGRLRRVEALAAANEGDYRTAARFMDQAQQEFRIAGDCAGEAIINQDRRLLAVRQDASAAVSEVLAGPPPDTPAGRLMSAMALKRRLRYEEALAVVVEIAADESLDPALRLPLLGELTALQILLRRGESVKALMPLLLKAGLYRFSRAGSDPSPRRFDWEIWDVLRVIEDVRSGTADHRRRFAEEAGFNVVESRIVELRDAASTHREIAAWHLAAGEFELLRYERSESGAALREAFGHYGKAAECAATASLTEIRIHALRRLGKVRALQRAHALAVAYWAEAHRLEEQLASLQTSDDARIHILLDASDEHDERIRVAAEAVADEERGDEAVAEAVAALVVAMEAARGAAILGRVLPGGFRAVRDLPAPGDLSGAWRWVKNISDHLPGSLVVWIVHATPDLVHHAIIGRNLLHHVAVRCRRGELADSIQELESCWSPSILEDERGRDAFDNFAKDIATRIGVGEVIRRLPPQIHRITIVAGGVLADVPFAALPIPGGTPAETQQAVVPVGTQPLGFRFALSDLPCLSVRRALERRSARRRGERQLLVSPLRDLASGRSPRRTVLHGVQATPERLETELRQRGYRQVWIYCHGQSDTEDSTQSWLQLAPAGPEGRLRPDRLQWMDLGKCGMLVLGSCESGMVQRVGRDERTGFVRAGLHAGVPAVVAARWVATAPVATAVLDRFQHHLRHLPRDVALQRAQLDVSRGELGVSTGVLSVGHPARWACWTLYGDPGWQAQAGPARRLTRLLFGHRLVLYT